MRRIEKLEHLNFNNEEPVLWLPIWTIGEALISEGSNSSNINLNMHTNRYFYYLNGHAVEDVSEQNVLVRAVTAAAWRGEPGIVAIGIDGHMEIVAKQIDKDCWIPVIFNAKLVPQHRRIGVPEIWYQLSFLSDRDGVSRTVGKAIYDKGSSILWNDEELAYVAEVR